MTNVKLTYEYTLNSIKVVEESIQQIHTKLAVILTVSGVLVNFGKDLPAYSIPSGSDYPCLSCYLLKLMAYVFIIIAILTAFRGLSVAIGGKIVLPEQLLKDEWNLANEEDYMTALIEYLEKETLLGLTKIRAKKASILNWAIGALATSAILFCLDEILAISIPVLG